ncbi:MAG: NAD(P)-binding domain-containing protein [Albidovulum sp.]
MRGLGIAGSARVARPFLARLQTAGFDVKGYAAPHTPDAFAKGLRVLLLVPRDIAEAEALLFEAEGFVKRAPSLTCIVIAATMSPRYIRALRGRISADIALIDAPYSGTLRAAEDGRLTFFLGGRREEIEPLGPLFDRLGLQAPHMGGFGTAMAAKVMNDFLAASTAAMMRTALDWAEAQGIDETRMLEMAEGTHVTGGAIPGFDQLEFSGVAADGDDCLTTLVKEVEYAFDAALTDAHLTPPRVMEELFRQISSRALH